MKKDTSRETQYIFEVDKNPDLVSLTVNYYHGGLKKMKTITFSRRINIFDFTNLDNPSPIDLSIVPRTFAIGPDMSRQYMVITKYTADGSHEIIGNFETYYQAFLNFKVDTLTKKRKHIDFELTRYKKLKANLRKM